MDIQIIIIIFIFNNLNFYKSAYVQNWHDLKLAFNIITWKQYFVNILNFMIVILLMKKKIGDIEQILHLLTSYYYNHES